MPDKIIYQPFVGDFSQDGNDAYAQGSLPIGIGTIWPCVMPGQVTPLTTARSPVLQQMGMMPFGGVEPDHVRLQLTAGDTPEQVDVPLDKVPFIMNCRVSFEPYQEGSGDPAPDNVRPIKGWTGAEAKRADTSGGTPTSVAQVAFPTIDGSNVIYGGWVDTETGEGR